MATNESTRRARQQFAPGGNPNLPIIGAKPAPGTNAAALETTNQAPLLTMAELGYPRVLGDLVLVQLKQPPARQNGVLLPESAQRPCEGVVLATGPGQHTQTGVLVPTALKPGDRVRFLEESFNARQIRGKLVIVLREVDILCVFGDAPSMSEHSHPIASGPAASADDYVARPKELTDA